MEQENFNSSILFGNNSLELLQNEILEKPRLSYKLQLKFYDVFVPVIGGSIIILNLLVVLSSGLILYKRPQPRSTYIFLGNIAFADLLTGVATLFGQYYPKENRSEFVCSLQIGLIVSSTLASIYSIALIAIDRYLYILHGLRYKQYLATRRARIMVLGTWFIGGIIGFLPAFGVRNPTNGARFCWLIMLEPTALILTTATIGIIPLFLIFALYFIILKRALGKIHEQRVSTLTTATTMSGLRYFRGESKKCNAEDSNRKSINDLSCLENSLNTEPKPHRSIFFCCRSTGTIKISSVYNPSRWKAIKIVMLTTGCFFITWCPYFIACALYVTCDTDTNVPKYCNNLRLAIASPLAILGLSNSLMNPIIYAWWHNGFRASSKKLCNEICLHRVSFINSFKTRASSTKTSNQTKEENIENISEPSKDSKISNESADSRTN